jgi:hypothetical protein
MCFATTWRCIGNLAVQTRFLPPLLSREEVSIRA